MCAISSRRMKVPGGLTAHIRFEINGGLSRLSDFRASIGLEAGFLRRALHDEGGGIVNRIEGLGGCQSGLVQQADEDGEAERLGWLAVVVVTNIAGRGPEIEGLNLQMKIRMALELGPGAGECGFRLGHGLGGVGAAFGGHGWVSWL